MKYITILALLLSIIACSQAESRVTRKHVIHRLRKLSTKTPASSSKAPASSSKGPSKSSKTPSSSSKAPSKSSKAPSISSSKAPSNSSKAPIVPTAAPTLSQTREPEPKDPVGGPTTSDSNTRNQVSAAILPIIVASLWFFF